MKRRYPVKTFICISLLTSVNYHGDLVHRLIDPSQHCRLAGDSSISSLSVISTARFEEHGGTDRLIEKQYEWFAVSSLEQRPLVMDFEALTWTGEFIEVTRSLPERLVGQSSGYYYVFDSPEGKVLIVSDMLLCS